MMDFQTDRTPRDDRITFSGLTGFVAMGLGLLFLFLAAFFVFTHYEASAIFGIVIYMPIGLLLLYLGYKLHYPRLTRWQTLIGFVLLAAAIISSHFFIMEGISENITGRLQTLNIIFWIAIESAMVILGFLMVRPLLLTIVSRVGLLVLETGFIIVAASFSQVFYLRPGFFIVIAIIGLLIVGKGFRLMRQNDYA